MYHHIGNKPNVKDGNWRAPRSSGRNTSRNPRHMPNGVPVSNRIRIHERNERLPFIPPEDWHEAHGQGGNFRTIVRDPGEGYRHVLTAADVRNRLAELPAEFTESLEVVQFSRMTRKKQSFPCYGMQWGSTIYLYPIESNLVESYSRPPSQSQQIEAKMYGGRWVQDAPHAWRLCWTEQAIHDFYLNNILIHELGHIVDNRNTNCVDRERYAEWFSVQYGYKPWRSKQPAARVGKQRHHAKMVQY